MYGHHLVAPWGGATFQPIQFPKPLTPKTNYHRKQGEDLLDYPFLTLGEGPASIRAYLAHPNFATFSYSALT